MANDTVYIRNNRPNRVVLQYAGLRVVLERRGSREDTASFPSDVLSDPTVARWLRANRIEQIEKDQFLDLSARTDAFDPNYRSVEYRDQASSDGRLRVKRSLEPAIVSDVNEVELPIEGPGSKTETIMDVDKIDKTLLSPRVEYRDEVEPTPRSVNPQETDIHALHRGEDAGRPVSEAPEDKLAESNVAQPKKAPAKKKAAGRPKAKAK